MRRVGLMLCGALAGCGATGDVPGTAGRASGAVTVTGADLPFTMSDGAAARQVADAQCGPRGVRTSIYDRFDNGAWVYPEGCA